MIDTKTLLKEIQENHRRLRNCPAHRFIPPKELKMGEKHKCQICHGTIGLTDLGYYIAGWEAMGGDAEDVWPGWNARRKTVDQAFDRITEPREPGVKRSG